MRISVLTICKLCIVKSNFISSISLKIPVGSIPISVTCLLRAYSDASRMMTAL